MNLPSCSVDETTPSAPVVTLVPLNSQCTENTAPARYWGWYVQINGVAGTTPVLDMPAGASGDNAPSPFPAGWHGQRGSWSQDGGATWNTIEPVVTASVRARFTLPSALTGDTLLFASFPMTNMTHAGELALRTELLTGAHTHPAPTADAQCVYNTVAAHTRPADGRVIPALEQIGYRITNLSAFPEDGSDKRKAIVITGQHPTEYTGRAVTHGLVRWLALDSGAEAQDARRWLDVYVYPLSNPSGVYGANHRGTFEPGHVDVSDPNRRWSSDSAERPPSIAATCDAILAALGSDVPMVMFDIHSPGPSEGAHAATFWVDNARPPAAGIVSILRQSGLFAGSARTESVATTFTGGRGTARGWFSVSLGYQQSITVETGALGESPGSVFSGPARFNTEGQTLGKAMLRIARRTPLGRRTRDNWTGTPL